MTEHTDTPAAVELAERVRHESPNQGEWIIYENDVYAQVFEFAEHRRLLIWDEADLMGSTRGYSWQEEVWTGSTWVDVTGISTDNTVPLTVDEIRVHLRTFRSDAIATRPEILTPREAALDRRMRRALSAAAATAQDVRRLTTQLRDTTRDLDAARQENARIRAALVALTNSLGAPGRAAPPAPPIDSAGAGL
ncbi:hypothetical protein [Microbacterium sp. NPDC055665]